MNNLQKEERNFAHIPNNFKEIKTGGANFRLGFGTGIENNTIINLLDDENRLKVANQFIKAKDRLIFPKSKRVIIDGGIYWTMGWCRLDII